MAVEARQHLNPFPPPQFIQNRDLLNHPNQGTASCAYNTQNMQFVANSFGAALPENLPFCPPAVSGGGLQAKPAVKADSGLTCNIPVPRKRSRDQLYATPNFISLQKQNSIASQLPSFACEDILPQIHQHQLEIDGIVSQHMKTIRLELEERQKKQAKLLVAAIGEGVAKIFKEKDDQIQRIGKLNLLLQERVKSLYAENQLLRDMAHTNEATANSLRTNLEQVLLQVAGEEQACAAAEAAEEVASCCGSIDDAEGEDTARYLAVSRKRGSDGGRCRKCGEWESSVLLLPCRHLCICNACGSGSRQVQACPVCNCSTNATLHVNLSS